MSNNKVEATFYNPSEIPVCKRFSGHVDVANRFSGQDTPLIDFPVKNANRFSGLKNAGLAAVYTFMALWCLLLVAAVLGMIVVLLVGYAQAWMMYPWWTLGGTVLTTSIYMVCYRATKNGWRLDNE